MEKVLIERFDNDPETIGRIAAESGRWELLIDKDNVPHLYVETNVEIDEGETVKGMFCIEDMLHDNTTIGDIMQSTFGGKLPPEEEEAAVEEWNIRHEKQAIPCPRRWARRPSVLSDPARYPTETVAEWTDAQVRDVYSLERLPRTDDIGVMRTLLTRLREAPDA